MDLSLYRPSDLELWICNVYQENGIQRAADIDIERIAALFNIEIRYTQKSPYVYYNDDGSDAMVFLKAEDTQVQKREHFFHELCHPLQHVGCQNELPPLFKELQEIQAAKFQLFAAMPFYMIQPYFLLPPSSIIRSLCEDFCLSEPFVKRRLAQIQARIRGEEWRLSLPRRRARLHPDIAIEKEHVREVIFELRRLQQARKVTRHG